MENKKKRLIIIDSHSVIHRAYHALPPLTTKKGELVNAIYGFLLVFFKALKEFQPDFVAAVFDLPAPTFRHKKFKEYKAKRPPTPENLSQQIPKIKEILKTFNIAMFEKEGFEADDIIGTISRLAPKKQIMPEIETIILSGDLDTLQLVDKNTKVYALKRGIKNTILYNRNKIEEKYQGLKPQQLSSLRGLKGDPSDNIPGVPGIGEKIAIRLINQYGDLEGLYQEVQSPNSKIKSSLKEKLLIAKEQAFFSKMLAQIKKDVPIDFNLKKCEWRDYNKQKVTKMLKNFEFYSLISRLPSFPIASKKINTKLPL